MARIALNARLLVPNRLEGIGWFTHECYSRLIASHPEHEFCLLFDRQPSNEFHYADHAIQRRVWPPARRPFLYDAWFDFGVAAALHSWNADVFVSTDGMLSRRTMVPQLAVFHDLNFMHHPEWMPKREANYYRNRFPEFAKIAQRIATVSEFSKCDIVTQFGVNEDDVDVVYNAPSSAYYPRPGNEAGQIEKDYADGNPYFIFVGSLHPRKNLGGLLEAFGKYREAGGINHLVIVGENMWQKDRAAEEGVHFVGRLDQAVLSGLMAAARALIFVPWFEGFGIPIVEAFASGTPVIASDTSSMPEVCGGAAAALVNPGESQEIAHAMLQIDRDSAFCDAAVQRGLVRAGEFCWNDSADRLWKSIEKIL